MAKTDHDEAFQKAQYYAFGDAKFATYATHAIYGWSKSDQRHVIRRLEQHADLKKRADVVVADIATGNGQFLFHLQRAFPRWQLRGYDYTTQFIDSAKTFPGLRDVHFECRDMYEMTEQFDVVTFLGTLPVFPDFSKPLAKLIELVKPGGRLIVDGYFNKWNVDLRVAVRDNSVAETKDVWRSHSNQHSELSVREWLLGQKDALGIESFEFIDMPMEDEIKRDPNKPHLNAWTFRDADGDILVTNGTNLVFRTRMLEVKKAS